MYTCMHTCIWAVCLHSPTTRCACLFPPCVSHSCCYRAAVCVAWDNGVHLFCEPLQHCIFVWLTLITLHFVNIKYKSLIIIHQISNVLLTVCLPCVAMMRYCECGTQGVSPDQWPSMLQGVGSGGLSHTHRTQLSYSLRQCTMASMWCSGTHSILEVSTYICTYVSTMLFHHFCDASVHMPNSDWNGIRQ